MASACSACGAPIVWCVTVHGKKSPVDEAPAPEGNLVRFDMGEGRGMLATAFDPNVHKGALRYVSHFVTCPKADRFRKPRKTGDK